MIEKIRQLADKLDKKIDCSNLLYDVIILTEDNCFLSLTNADVIKVKDIFNNYYIVFQEHQKPLVYEEDSIRYIKECESGTIREISIEQLVGWINGEN